MKRDLAILLWATEPDRPHLCGTPFFHAAAAAAMDARVEVFFTARSVRLLVKGVADEIYPGAGRERSVGEYMRHAVEHGARFFACSQAMAAHGVTDEMLIAEVVGKAGATAFAGRCVDEAWVTLVY